MKKIIVRKTVGSNINEVMDLISKTGIPNRAEKIVRKQINSIDPQNPLLDTSSFNFISLKAIEKSLLSWQTDNVSYQENNQKPLPLGVVKVKYELCEKAINQTSIKYTISYNTMKGVSGFFIDKFMVVKALRKIARKNLDQLQHQLSTRVSSAAA
ncbi:MAG: hypothetical protein AAFO69_04860 [Bacteroidota bacterium]